MDPVILSVAKNLVSMQVLPFSLAQGSTLHRVDVKKSGIWVLRDEILRYAQNDKGGARHRTRGSLQIGPSMFWLGRSR